MTYTIQRYPVRPIDVVRLANGSRIIACLALPQDIERRSAHKCLQTATRGACNRRL